MSLMHPMAYLITPTTSDLLIWMSCRPVTEILASAVLVTWLYTTTRAC